MYLQRSEFYSIPNTTTNWHLVCQFPNVLEERFSLNNIQKGGATT